MGGKNVCVSLVLGDLLMEHLSRFLSNTGIQLHSRWTGIRPQHSWEKASLMMMKTRNT